MQVISYYSKQEENNQKLLISLKESKEKEINERLKVQRERDDEFIKARAQV